MTLTSAVGSIGNARTRAVFELIAGSDRLKKC